MSGNADAGPVVASRERVTNALPAPTLAHRWPGALCVLLGVAAVHVLALFNAGAYIATLPQVAAGLGQPPSFGTWTQTDYLTSLAVGIPLARAFAARWGDAWVFRTATAGFAAASAACALAPGLGLFLAARIVLGVCGGMALPAGQRLFVRTCLALGLPHGPAAWGLLALSPFSLGTAFGGWLTDTHGWRALFEWNLFVALAALLLTALAWRRAQATVPPPAGSFDWVGYGLLAATLYGLQTLLNLGNDLDWLANDGLRALAFVTWLLACAWGWRVWRHPDPGGFSWSCLASPDFMASLAGLVLGFLCFQGLLSLLIVQLQLTLDYTATTAGQVFLPLALGGFPVALAVQRWMRPQDARWLACLGLLGLGAVYGHVARFEQPHAFGLLFGPKLVEGICTGLVFGPLSALAVRQLEPPRQPGAAELAFLLRLAAGAIGITLAGVVLYRQAAFHQSLFVDGLSPLDPVFDEWRGRLAGAGLTPAQIPAKLGQIVTRHARLMAIDDAFRWAGWLCTGLGVLVALVKLLPGPRRVGAQVPR